MDYRDKVCRIFVSLKSCCTVLELLESVQEIGQPNIIASRVFIKQRYRRGCGQSEWKDIEGWG